MEQSVLTTTMPSFERGAWLKKCLPLRGVLSAGGFLLAFICLNFTANAKPGASASAGTISITSFSPQSGPVGTMVTVNGTGLSSPTSFTIGGVSAVVVSNTGTQIVALVMPGATTGNVTFIINLVGSAVSSTNFTVTGATIPITPRGSGLSLTGGGEQSNAIAVSADGNTALIGAQSQSYGGYFLQGEAVVYTRSGGVWAQSAILEGSGSANGVNGGPGEGSAVTLSADGNTAAISAVRDNEGTGAVWIFTRSGSTWTQQGDKLLGSDNNYEDFGASIALSADGNTLVMGAPSENGAAFIFTRSSGTWTQAAELTPVTGNDGVAFGTAVAISADGSTVLIGGDGDNNGVGGAWVYAGSGGNWAQQGSELIPTDEAGPVGSRFGSAAALSADGNTAIISGNFDEDALGAVWIFTRSSGTWSQQGSKLSGADASGTLKWQGSGVGISADGNTVFECGQGIANTYVFSRSGSTWTQADELSGPTGTSLAVTPDMQTLLVQTGEGDASVFAAPQITYGAPSGTISTCVGTASASPNVVQFTVSGANMANNITVAAPAGFELSTNGTTYSNSLTLAQSGGVVATSTIYARSSSTDGAGIISGNVVLSSTGAISQNVALTGIVNGPGTVSTITNQTVGSGVATTAVNLGTATYYSWTNDTPSIGLAASGSGNIASFTAANTGSSPVKATVTVTPYAPGATSYAYIANNGDGTVSVINTATGTVLPNPITVGKNPYGVAASADGTKVYVTNSGDGTVSVISTQTNTVVATVTVGTSPIGIVVTPDGRQVYVVNTSSKTVSVFSGINYSPIATITLSAGGGNYRDIIVSPDGASVFVEGNTTKEMTKISTSSNTIVGNQGALAMNGNCLATSPGSPYFYEGMTSGGASGIVYIYNLTGNAIYSGTVNLQNQFLPNCMALSNDGATLYIGLSTSAVLVGNIAARKITAKIITAANVNGIWLSPDGGTLYAVLSNGTVDVINIASATITNTITVGSNPVSFGNFISTPPGCTGTAATFTYTVNPSPSVTISGTPAGLSTITGTASTATSFSASGTWLQSAVTVTAATGFEVSSDGSTYGSTATLTPDGSGNISSATLYVRLAAADAAGSYSGNVALNSANLTQVNVPVSGTVISAPVTQASAVGFSGVGQMVATISWTPGNGSSEAVFISQGSSGSPSPVNNTTYTGNTAFGSGSQIGNSGWYCVFNGAGSSVNVTGLSASTAYNVMVVDYNGPAGSEQYLTASGAGNPATVTTAAPPQPAISSFSPASGPVGTLVTISGSNLSSPSALTIGGQPAIVISNDGSTLVAMVMPNAVTGGISLTTTGGTTDGGSSFTIANAVAPLAQQGSKLTEAGGAFGQFGSSASLSADGNTALIGAPLHNGQGDAAIFTRLGGAWTQATVLTGSGSSGGFMGGAGEGHSAALSADGKTAVIGANEDNNNKGAIWVFTNSGGTWTQQGSKIVATNTDGGTFDNQGISVGISADGNTIVVGGMGANSGAGAAWVFTRSGGVWSQAAELTGTGSGTGQANQGSSVAISADGATILVAGKADNNDHGAVWVFTGSGSTWTQQGTKLTPSDGDSSQGGPYFGSSAGLSADGNTAVIGGPADAFLKGASWIFTRSSGTWSQQGAKLVGSGGVGQSQQGWSAAISADGNTVIEGALEDNNSVGAAWVFTRNGSAWAQQGTKTVGTGATNNGSQGSSVAISADGNTALEGASVDNGGVGAAWAFFGSPAPATPSTQASNVSFTNTAQTSVTVGWTPGNGSSEAVFVSQSSSGSAAPDNNTAYNPNTTFAQGDQIDNTGWYCVYNGSGSSSVDITGLSANTPYTVMVVDYNGASGSEQYLTTTASGNPATFTSSPVTFTVDFGSSFAFDNGDGSIEASVSFLSADGINDGTLSGLSAGNFSVSGTNGMRASIHDISPSGNTWNLDIEYSGTSGGNITLAMVNSNGTTPAVSGLPVTISTINIPATPAPSIGIGSPSVSSTSSGPVSYTVNYSDNAFGAEIFVDADASLVNLNLTGTAQVGNVSVNDNGDGSTYTVTLSGITGNGTVGISLSGGSVQDGSTGLQDNGAGPSATFAVVNQTTINSISAVAPTVAPTNVAFVDYNVTFGAAISGLSASNFSFNTTGAMAGASVYSITTKDNITFDVTVGTGTGSGTLQLQLANATGLTYGISNTLPFNGDTYTFAAGPRGLINLFINGTTSSQTTANVGDEIDLYFEATGAATMSASVDGGNPANVQINPYFGNWLAVYNIKPTDPTGPITEVITLTDASGNSTQLTANGITLLIGAAPTPSTQASNVTVTNTSQTGTTINWTPGNGTSEAVFLLNSSVHGSPSPVNNTTYAASAAFRSGTQIGGTGWYCVYNGSGSGSVDVTGLSAGSPYQVMVLDYNGAAGSEQYLTDAVDSNPNSFTTSLYNETVTFNTLSSATYGDADIALNATSDNSNVAINYQSDNTSVATIVNGSIHIVAAGSANIKASQAADATHTAANDVIQSLTVNPAPLIITADSKSIAYGAALPVLSASYSGFVNNEDQSVLNPGVSLSTTAVSSTTAGQFTITATGAADPNYSISYVSGLLTIGAASNIATLSAMGPSVGPLTPAFTPGVGSYSINVSNATASFTVKPVSSNPNAIIKVNTITTPSGTTSAAVALTPNVTTTITVLVTAQDNSTTQTYTINVTRAPNSIATLSAIGSSVSPLTPIFNSGVTSYSLSVPNATATMTVQPVTTDPNATMMVNTAPLLPGNISGTIALTEGAATAINVVVTAQDHSTTKTYTINVNRAASSNDLLTTIGCRVTPLSPIFNSGITSYTLSVPNATATMTVKPVTADANAKMTVNNTPLASGGTSAAIPLAEGTATPINIVVTAQDGSTKTYTVNITRAASGVATLSAMGPSVSPLTPIFNSGVTSYSLSVPNATATMTVQPVTTDVNAKLMVNNTPQTSGAISGAIALAEGVTTAINVVVTSQDNSATKTYTINVSRAASGVATLASMGPSVGPLSPLFTPGTTSYTLSVPNSTATMTVQPVTTDANAKMTVNNSPLTSGTVSGALALAEGTTTAINVVVISQDNSTTKTYTINVTRAPSSDATLSVMAPSISPLTPVFNSGVTSYTLSVGSGTATMTVQPVTNDVNAKIQVNNAGLISGTLSNPIALAQGATTPINVTVTAQDNSTIKTYTILVTRAFSNNANLAVMGSSISPLTPVFNPGNTGYTLNVSNATTSMTIQPVTADVNATMTISTGGPAAPALSGALYGPITLVVGTTTISVAVTAADGTTVQTYTILVTRAKSSNANLSSIGSSITPLTPIFNSATTDYTLNVPNTTASMTVKPVTADVNATMTLNTATLLSGATSDPVALTAGATTPVSVVVTAADGTIKTYTIQVTRAAGSTDSFVPIAIGTGISVTRPTETPALAEDGIVIHQGVSPNGDGINDFLQIDNISQYPDNKLTIMNRNGQLVYEAKGYDNSSKAFDGHSNKNGQMQLPGTYFYQLDYTVNGTTKHKTGFIILKY